MTNITATDMATYALLTIAGLAGVSAFQIWFYNYAYKRGHEIGSHTGFTKGLFQGKMRENQRLTRQAKGDKISVWAKTSQAKQTIASSTP